MKELLKEVFIPIIAITVFGFAQSVCAKTDASYGKEIVTEAVFRDDGFADFSSDVTMTLHHANGKQIKRYLTVKSLEVADDGEMRLFIFSKPRDIKGTAVLNHSHILDDDDQWIYLPAFKRVKRISSSNKTGAFVSSEFSYEDLTSMEVDKFSYHYIGEDTLDGLPVFVVEMAPAYQDSGYTRQVAYIDQAEYLFRKIEFYDLDNTLSKTLSLQDYNQYLEQFWRPSTTLMVNHQNNNQTVMKWENIEFKKGLSANHFNKNALKRSR